MLSVEQIDAWLEKQRTTPKQTGNEISTLIFADVRDIDAVVKKLDAKLAPWSISQSPNGRPSVMVVSPQLSGGRFFVDQGGEVFPMERCNYAFPSGKIYTTWIVSEHG